MLTHFIYALLAHDVPFVFADVQLDVPMNNAPAVGALQTFLTNPTFIMFLLGLISLGLAAHPLHRLALLLKARAVNEAAANPVAAKVENVAASLADILDAYLSANGQDVKDLIDPTKRAAAEAHLVNSAKATVAAKLATAVTIAGVP